MGPGDKGDCEDYALTKMQELLDTGWNAKNLQMAVVATDTVTDHAVLLIQTHNRGTLILDNRYDAVVEVATTPYRFVAYQRAGTDWRYFSTMLETVPIEYKNCNAAAFADNDPVVVKFEGQDFSQPKVVGFQEYANDCWLDYYVTQGRSSVDADISDPFDIDGTPYNNHRYFDVNGQAWILKRGLTPTWPNHEDTAWQRFYPALTSNSSHYWLFGGLKWDPPVFGLTRFYYAYPYLDFDENVSYCDRYSKQFNSWESRQDIPGEPRNDPAAFMLSGKSHIIGGSEHWYNTYTECLNYEEHEQFDDALNTYVSKRARRVTRAATWELDDKGYIYGGWIAEQDGAGHTYPDPDYWTGEIIEYDPTTDLFTGKLGYNPRIEAAFFQLGGKGYAFGGWRETSIIPDLDEWTKETNSWAAKTPFDNYSWDSLPAVGAGAGAFVWVPNADAPYEFHQQYESLTDAWASAGPDPETGFDGRYGGRATL